MTVSRKKGFTLIELLVVISIISILSGAAYVYSTSARERTIETAHAAETNEIKKALEIYRLEKGNYPPNYTNSVAQEDGDPNGPYAQSMQHLVDADLFPDIPESHYGDAYFYYNLGDDTPPYVGYARHNTSSQNTPTDMLYIGSTGNGYFTCITVDSYYELKAEVEEDMNPGDGYPYFWTWEEIQIKFPDDGNYAFPDETSDICYPQSYPDTCDYYNFEYCPYPVTS